MYYGYARVSTGTQAEKGYGLDVQQGEIMRYARANDVDVAQIFIDAGISGAVKDTDDDDAISKRPALVDMLATIKEGDGIIVLNTSRLWRSDTAKVIIRRELMRRKAQIISIEQPRYDLYATDPNDRLIAGMLELLDEWDRASIALKLARGRTVKAKGGDKPAGVTPYGYKYAEDKKSVVINEEEAQHVKLMFSEAQQGVSLARIADELNAQGVKTRQGKAWQRGSIAAILHNTFYKGTLRHNNTEMHGNHTPLISKIQFGKVQAALERKSKQR